MSKVKEVITAKANQSNRTFTIRKYVEGDKSQNKTSKLIAKYRTIPMSIEEFESCENNTENDWKQFLKSEDYYAVK